MMDTLNRLKTLARQSRSTVERRRGEMQGLTNRRTDLMSTLATAKERAETISQVGALLKEASVFARTQSMDQVSALTTSALQAVVGPGYQFRLEAKERAGQAAVACRVISPYTDGGEIETEGNDSRGGGIVDLQALALRMAMLETYVPRIDGPLLLDEPAKHVSEENISAVGTFLEQTSEVFERQVIMVTHSAHLAARAARTIRIELFEGASEVV